MLVSVIKSVTRRVLPGGKSFRRLPFGPAAGCTMKVNLHHDLRLFLGFYEIETQKWFKTLVHPGYKSFDVGGAGGYDALLLSKLSNGAPVISFECDDVLVSEMAETFARNAYPIKAVQAFVCERNDGGHISLDAAAERYFVPDFMKLDIEGAEADALKGAAKILRKRKPSMIVGGGAPIRFEIPANTGLGSTGGGRGGIRTHGTLAGTPVFKTGRLNHSRTLPIVEDATLFSVQVRTKDVLC
jgi:hypothetical protein